MKLVTIVCAVGYIQTDYYQTSKNITLRHVNIRLPIWLPIFSATISRRDDYSVFLYNWKPSLGPAKIAAKDVNVMCKTVRCPENGCNRGRQIYCVTSQVANPSTTLARLRLTIYRPRVPSRSNWFSMMLSREKRRSRQFRKSDLPLRLSSQNSKLKST